MDAKSAKHVSVGCKAIWIGIGIAALFWVLVSAIDIPLFHEGVTIKQRLIPNVHEIWIRLLVVSVLIAFGSYAQFMINRAKQAKEALQESQAELSTILDNGPIAMFLLDRERRVLRANRAAVNFAGRSAKEIIGLRVGEAIRCNLSLDHPNGCGSRPFCQVCLLRSTVLDTFETGNAHHRLKPNSRLFAWKMKSG